MRIETGVVMVDDDWPGVFIRGDNAFAYAMTLRRVAETMTANNNDQFDVLMLNSMISLLERSDVSSKEHKVDHLVETKSIMKTK